MALMAVIAAVLLPTVAGQLTKAEVQQVGDGATTVRSAVNQFIADVRRFPADFEDLTTRPVDDELGLVGGEYSSSEILRWAGPYLQKDETAARVTGWDLSFASSFGLNSLGDTGLGAGPQQYQIRKSVV